MCALLIGAAIVWFPLFYVLHRVAGDIDNRNARALTQAVICAVFFTPSVGVGHGIAPAPAIVVLFFPQHFFIGIVPMFVVALIVYGVKMSRRSNDADMSA